MSKTNVKNRTVVDEIEKLRVEMIRPLILQGFRNELIASENFYDPKNELNATEKRNRLESIINSLVTDFNDRFLFESITVDVTNMIKTRNTLCYFKSSNGYKIHNILIERIKIGELFQIYDANEADDDPLRLHCKPIWSSRAPVILVDVHQDQHYMLIYTEDCKVYRVSATPTVIGKELALV